MTKKRFAAKQWHGEGWGITEHGTVMIEPLATLPKWAAARMAEVYCAHPSWDDEQVVAEMALAGATWNQDAGCWEKKGKANGQQDA